MLLLLLVTFLDGTNVQLQVPADSKWEVHTSYGVLTIPLSELVECEFGIHVKDEAPYINAVKAMGYDDFKTRDAAMKFMRKDLRSAYKFVHNKTNDPDKEVARRAEILVKESGVFKIQDFIRMKDASFSGDVKSLEISGKSDALGELKLDVCKIKIVSVKHAKTVIGISYGVWTPASWVVGGKLKITARGTIDLYPQSPGQYTCGPDGYGTTLVGSYLPGALIGRVGGKEFLIGSGVDASGLDSGRLEIRINRNLWRVDAVGEFAVEIE